MGEENEKPDWFNWIGIVKLALHFPFRKLGRGWYFRLNWKEGGLMVGNKRKWSSIFGLIFICVTYLFGLQKLLYSDWMILSWNRKTISYMGLMGPKRGEESPVFWKCVSQWVLLVLLKWMSHLTWCGRSHVLQLYWLGTYSAFHKVGEEVLHLLLTFVAGNGRILIVVTLSINS